MALYTDTTPANLDDLRRLDSNCEELAKDAQINLDNKLDAAADEVGQEILSFLLFQGLSESRQNRQRRGLSDVVVTTSVRRWHAVRTLAELYRDASGVETNDRFRRKWKQYEELAKTAAEQAFTTGIGLVRTAVPRAPMASLAETGAASQRLSRNIQITWVAADGTEGTAGQGNPVMAAPGDVVTPAEAAPDGVTGWNVYIGIGEGTPLLQNETPLACGSAWQIPFTLAAGRPLRTGQDPDFFVVERRILPRG